MTENCVFVRYFAKFPPTRTKISSDGGLDASDGGCSPPRPSPGATPDLFSSRNLTITFYTIHFKVLHRFEPYASSLCCLFARNTSK